MSSEDVTIGNVFNSRQWSYFIGLTIAYFAAKYSFGGDDIKGTVFTGIYFMLLFALMVHLNNTLIMEKCHGISNNTIFLIVFGTLLPWMGILGVTYILITIMPGWKAPFSNTFGYAAIYLAGAENTLSEIIQTKYSQNISDADASKISGEMKLTSSVISSIYENKALLINEVTPDNYTQFWEKIKPIMRPGVYNNNALFAKFASLIQLKDIVSECIWFLLSGLLSMSISINTIMNSHCNT